MKLPEDFIQLPIQGPIKSDRLTYKGKTITLREFIEIQEAISPRSVKYGTNSPVFDNSEFETGHNDTIRTLFLAGDYLGVCAFENKNAAEIGFGVLNKASIENWKQLSNDLLSNIATDVRFSGTQKDAFIVFGNFMFILGEYLKKYRPHSFFVGETGDRRMVFYERILKQPAIKRFLSDLQYVSHDDPFSFTHK